jgi:hypothetical protein
MNKEQIYDEQINPLMAKIIAICKEHKIATVASFAIPTDEDEGLMCTTALTTPEYEPPDVLRQIVNILYPPLPPMMRITQRDAAGQVVKQEIIQVIE